MWGDDNLEDAVGRGLLARTEVEPGRYREIGLLEEPADAGPMSTGRLLLPVRWQAGRSESPSMDLELVGDPLLLSPVADDDLAGREDQLWPSLVARLAQVCLETAERGEVLLVERGGVVHEPWPYTLLAVTREPDESWVSHLEASPAPGPGTPGWDQVTRGRNEDGADSASLSAAATNETVRGAGFLLAVTAAQWAETPQDLAITYTAAPSCPVELLSGMAAIGRDDDK